MNNSIRQINSLIKSVGQGVVLLLKTTMILLYAEDKMAEFQQSPTFFGYLSAI
jgi:hypothetical protein